MTKEQQTAWNEWLETRPECVQNLAKRFPLGMKFLIGNHLMYLIGYSEKDELLLTSIDPAKDYDNAVEKRIPIKLEEIEYLTKINERN